MLVYCSTTAAGVEPLSEEVGVCMVEVIMRVVMYEYQRSSIHQCCSETEDILRSFMDHWKYLNT